MSQAKYKGYIDHFALKCENLEKSVEDYKALGFTVESLFEDWAMMRDPRGFGIALLPPDSKHPPHMALRVDSMEELERASQIEGRPIKPHRDGTSSFYTKGVDGMVLEVIYFPS